MASSVCDICRGLFDKESPRGFVKDRNENVYQLAYVASDTNLVYSYIHRKTGFDVVKSGRAGCDVCKIIGTALGGERTFGGRISVSLNTPGGEPTQPISAAQAAQSEGFDLEGWPEKSDPDKDKWEPSKLARFLEEHPSLKFWHFLFCCDERVVIQHGLREQGSPASDTRITMSLVYDIPNSTESSIYHFNTPFDPIDPEYEHRPSNDPLSESHIRLINRWRHICEEKHESCRKIAYHQTLPTRILEIPDRTDEVGSVRLVETHGKAQGTYACLSYCWGDSETQIGQTTRGNLSRQLELIPFKDLPSTVVDAIRLCCKLGFQYLWVDRLCIVQDDSDDWLEEASRMSEVYSRSALTISVPICTDSSESFLSERAKGFRQKGLFTTVTYDGHTSDRYQRWFSSDPLSRENGPWFLEHDWRSDISMKTSSGRNSWLGRCWTFQEWMLSPRVLHIDSMTLWDCFDGYANELNCRYIAGPNVIRNPSQFGKDISWDFIVQEFSKRKITREEDRLPALAGLATSYAKATGHSYLAGLWVEDLPRSLLWEQRRSPNRGPPPPGHRHIPSWAWCSLNGAVWYLNFAKNDSYSDPFISSASITPMFGRYQPPRSFSKVEKASIEIECRVSAVTTRNEHTVYAGGTSEWWYINYDYAYGENDRNGVEDEYLLFLGANRSFHGALFAEMFKRDDGSPCFQRLGVARRSREFGGSPENDPQWETKLVRLV